MSDQGTWVDQALREHEEHAREEHAGPARPSGTSDREQQVLDRIDRARRRRPKVREERITMSHGAGGKATRTLVEAVFLDAFTNPLLDPLEDAAQLHVNGGRVALTTDSYVVSPLFFPGGDIGDLAVNGTVNDLAVSGATPLYLSAGFILEEGFPVTQLQEIVASMQAAAQVAGVQVVTGDTKVVQRGKADGCYINTAGVGVVEHDMSLGVANAQPGDAVIVSGPIGDHGVTIMLARGELDIEADITSDTAALNGLIADLLAASSGGPRAARRHPGRRGHHPQRGGHGGRCRGARQRGRDPGAHRGARRLRTARHRSHVRGVRGPDGGRGGRRRGGPGPGRAAVPPAGRGRRDHRPDHRGPDGHGPAEDRVRRHPDRGPAGR